MADRILATEIDREYQGDACFPEFEKGHWRETARESREDAASGLRYCFVTLERRA
ncbi:MAG: dihydrofolate reductase [Burkholderiales bacterium]